MTRTPQPDGGKGSQRWLQHLVATNPAALQPPGLPPLTWVSPRAADGFAEYSDADFLDQLGLARLAPALGAFWPQGGPRWDGLALAGGSVVLVEAKAHVAEALSTPSAARSPASRARIAASLSRAKQALGADDRSDWARCFYQYANRLAHLWWLRQQGVDAHLLFVGFIHAPDVPHPATESAWEALYLAANHALGLTPRHPLAGAIHHIHPDPR